MSFIDGHVDEPGDEAYVARRDEVVERRLRDGSTFCGTKNFADPQEVEPRLGLRDRPGRRPLGIRRGTSREIAKRWRVRHELAGITEDRRNANPVLSHKPELQTPNGLSSYPQTKPNRIWAKLGCTPR